MSCVETRVKEVERGTAVKHPCAPAHPGRHVSQTLTFAKYACDIVCRMTLENLLSQVGIGTKQLTDRYSGEYGAPVQDQHVYYAYEHSQPSHVHTASSKHHYGGGGGLKSNASMSALTLLAFLFFLHILQQCIKEHMTEMSSTPVVVMSASREGDDSLSKANSKLDKTGVTEFETDAEEDTRFSDTKTDGDKMLKINAAEYKPKTNIYSNPYKNNGNSFPGYVSAVNDN